MSSLPAGAWGTDMIHNVALSFPHALLGKHLLGEVIVGNDTYNVCAISTPLESHEALWGEVLQQRNLFNTLQFNMCNLVPSGI